MKFVIQRGDGLYAKIPHQRIGGASLPTRTGGVTWYSQAIRASKFTSREWAEHVAGQVKPSEGIEVRVVEVIL